MKLIIDIHQEQYEFIKQGMPIDKVMQFPALMEAICGYIANGTPVVDDDPKIYVTIDGKYIDEAVSLDYINDLATIIKADKESEG